MKIAVLVNEGVAVLKPEGRMMFEPSLFQMRGHIQEQLAAGVRRFVVDLSAVTHVDSSACGELISGYTSISRLGGAFVLVNPQPRVKILLQRIRLNQIFHFFDTVEQAVSNIT